MGFTVLCVVLIVIPVLTAACPYGCSLCDGGRLRCPGAGLTSLPSPIPADTYTIDITQNNIDSLDGLANLPEVQSFRMSLNQLRVIKGGDFEKMPSLQSLDLSMNAIIKVYKEGFRGLKDLQSISLNGNKLKEIGTIFTNTPMISSLRLGNNEIEKIEEENFEKNSMLKLLDLSHNMISSIHGNAFKNLDMLRYLILSNNPITTLPDLTFSSTMLSLADISSCQLETVPRTMPPSLTDFRLGNNKITRINQDDFQNITDLNLLTLNDNQISEVEYRAFENLEKLSELWLSRNNLIYIPRGLPKGLKKLFIDNNQVVELEPMLFKAESQLKVLSLETNNLRRVHNDSLQNVQKLEKLNFQGNDITSLEAGTFTNLVNLQALTLTENPIRVIESGAFGTLESLMDLSMSYIDSPENVLQENFLLHMPSLVNLDLMSSVQLAHEFLNKFDEAGGVTLDHVKKVNLQYNELTTISEGVKNIFPNIQQLLLDGNLLQCDRRLLWLRAWMQATTVVSFHQYEPATCHTPESVKGRLISDLPHGQFAEVPETLQESTSNSEGVSSRDNAPTAASADLLQTSPDPISWYNQHRVIAGTRVIIKPPSNPTATNRKETAEDDKNDDQDALKDENEDTSMTKAERKAARLAEKARRRKLNEEQKKNRRNKRKKDNEQDKKRKKRKIRNKNGKSCKVDKDGKTKCRRRKRCDVDADGNIKCQKRKNKKNDANSKNVA